MKFLRDRKETESIHGSPKMYSTNIMLQRVYPSERQSTERGVKYLKGHFLRLILILIVDIVTGYP